MSEGGSGQAPRLKVDDFVAPLPGKAVSIFLSEAGKPYARLYFDPKAAKWIALSAQMDESTGESVRCFVLSQERSGGAVIQPIVGRRLRIMRFTRDGRDVHGRLL